MRDLMKSDNYYNEYIDSQTKMIQRFKTRLNKSVIPDDRREIINMSISSLEWGLFVARYSSGDSFDVLKIEFEKVTKRLLKYWKPGSYHLYLSIISVFVLLNIHGEIRETVLKNIQAEGTNDWLFNFLLHYNGSNLSEIQGDLLFPDAYASFEYSEAS